MWGFPPGLFANEANIGMTILLVKPIDEGLFVTYIKV
jgi:hypothetical protein